MLRIGYHVSIAGTVDLAFDRAREVGCTAMQVFLSNPRGWGVKALSDTEISSFRAKENSFRISPVFAHMPYLPNITSPNAAAYKKSLQALSAALERCNLLGIRYLILHLGSHLGQGKPVGLRNAFNAIKSVEGKAKGVVLLLENEAGQRNSMGSSLEDLLELYEMLHNKLDVDVGFCLDTCHVFEAGYDIRKKEVVSEIFGKLGSSRIKVIHLNDAKFELGRALDRHENIGYGFIGQEGFKVFLRHRSARGKPLIMETPMRSPETDRQEMSLVRSLLE